MAGWLGRSRPHLNFAGKARGYPSPDNYAVGPTVGLVKVNGQIPSVPLRSNPISPNFLGWRLVSDYDSSSSRVGRLLTPKS